MISDDLRKLAEFIPKGSIVILHVGLRGLYDNSDGYSHQALTFLDDIRTHIAPTEIYVPTFTYDFTKSKIFDVQDSPAVVGRFSDEIRRSFASCGKRSLDPIFSIVETENVRSIDSNLVTNAFEGNSIWHYLDGIRHYILNINIPESIISTQLHHLEYTQHVPYRHNKIFEGEVIDLFKKKFDIKYEYFVRDLNKDLKWNRKKIADLARCSGGLIETGTIRSFDWQVLKTALLRELSQDINYLVRK